jgi:hypothetical protein
LVDEVVAAPNWPAGNSTTKRSMERNADLNDWHTFAELTADTTTALYATPKKENSVIVDESQDQPPEDQNNEEDDLPPEDNPPAEGLGSSINDLKAEIIEGVGNSLALSWTELSGADDYEIYYSIGESVDPDNLKNITDYENIEIIKDNGTARVELGDLYWGYDYYFAVKGKDSQNNYSSISNIVKQATFVANHQRALGWGNNRRSGQIAFAGPTGEREAAIFASEQDNISNDDVSSPPIIDANGAIYFKAKFDGKQGLYAYDDNGLKWVYEFILSTYNPVAMNKDGTIYFISGKSVYAITPSGKLKWKQTFHNIYTLDPAINSDGEVYIIGANDLNHPILVKISDKINDFEQEEVCNLSASVGSVFPEKVSEIIFDSADNVYFSINNSLFAFGNNGNILLERRIDIVFADSYEKNGTETDYIEQVYLSPDESMVALNVPKGFYNSIGTRTVLYAFNVGEVNGGNPVWTRRFGENGNILGVGNNALYYRESLVSGWGFVNGVAIHGINFSDGADIWVKEKDSPVSVSDMNIDTDNQIYFYQGSCIYGFNSNVLSLEDSSWETGKIFCSCGKNAQANNYPLSMGSGVMYIPARSQILKAAY